MYMEKILPGLVLIIIFLILPQFVFADSLSTGTYYIPEPDLVSATEWFAFQFGLGTYLGTVQMDFITIRRPAFYWELMHWRTTAFWTVGHMEFGTLGGAVIHLNKKSEIRTGLGLVYSLYIDGHQDWHGFGVTPQISYLFNRRNRFVWETTFALHIPVSGEKGTDPGYEHLGDDPMEKPLIFTCCFGFRI
ncbi:MAG: hypothetical protein APR63_04960 [Desulfuromonas sp. SDB]|nr:MAG: hypothetical protein APR63_04960 [Desulfuromonas sp. SDB]